MAKLTTPKAAAALTTYAVEQRGVMTPAEMLNTALTRDAGIDVIERLMGLYERWQKNEAKKAFDNAMAAAKAKFPKIKKTKPVKYPSRDNSKPPTDFMHEGLDDISIIDPILAEFGLSWRHRSSQDGSKITIICIITHRDGYAEETPLSADPDKSGNKNDIQAVSSTVTYLRRYTLKLALGLVTEDDIKTDDDGRGGPPKPISAAQLKVITDLCEQTTTDEGIFARHMGDRLGLEISRLAEIPDKAFELAKRKLQIKLKKQSEPQS